MRHCLRMRVVLVALLLFNANAKLIYGTTIVVIVTRDQIALAADSQGTGAKSGRDLGRLYCKIRSAKNYLFAVSGFAFWPQGSFDALATVTADLKAQQFEEVTAEAEGKLKTKLLTVVRQLWRNNQDRYKQIKPESKAITTLVIATFGEHGPQAIRIHLGIRFAPNTEEPIEIVRREQATCDGSKADDPCIMTVGAADEFETFAAEHQEVFDNKIPAAELARFIVTYEAILRNDVGTPVDVVVINSKNRIRWIDRKSSCSR